MLVHMEPYVMHERQHFTTTCRDYKTNTGTPQ